MKKKMNFLLVALLLASFVMMSCDTGTNPDTTPDPDPVAQSGTITVNLSNGAGIVGVQAYAAGTTIDDVVAGTAVALGTALFSDAASAVYVNNSQSGDIDASGNGTSLIMGISDWGLPTADVITFEPGDYVLIAGIDVNASQSTNSGDLAILVEVAVDGDQTANISVADFTTIP